MTSKFVCPICRRAVARRADGRIAHHGGRRYPGMRMGGGHCPTSGWVDAQGAVEAHAKQRAAIAAREPAP